YEGLAGSSLPPALIEKVLLDVPAIWARFSVGRRHVLAYDIPLITAPSAEGGGADVYGYLLAAENLHTTVQALLGAVEQIAKLPGANLVRDSRGGTVQDLASQLIGYDHVAANPIYHQVLALAYRQDEPATETVFGMRLTDYKRHTDLEKFRAGKLDEAFERYVRMRDGGRAPAKPARDDSGPADEAMPGSKVGGSAVVAQIGDDILTKLMRSTEAAEDLKYRQRLNDEAMQGQLDGIRAEQEFRFASDAFERVRALATTAPHESADATMQRLREAMAALDAFSKRRADFCRMISEQNLNPESQLYRLDAPFVLTKHTAVGAQAATLGGLGVAILAFLVALAACALHQARRNATTRREG